MGSYEGKSWDIHVCVYIYIYIYMYIDIRIILLGFVPKHCLLFQKTYNYFDSSDPHRGILDNCSDSKCATRHTSGTYSEILSGIPCGIYVLTFFLAFFYLAYILTFFLAYIPAFYLASFQVFILASKLWHSLGHQLRHFFWHSFWH